MTQVQRVALAWLTGAAVAAGAITWAGEAALGALAVPAPAAVQQSAAD